MAVIAAVVAVGGSVASGAFSDAAPASSTSAPTTAPTTQPATTQAPATQAAPRTQAPIPLGATVGEPDPDPTDAPRETFGGTVPTSEPERLVDTVPPTQTSPPDEPGDTDGTDRIARVPPTVRSSDIPLGSILLAGVVLIAAGLAAGVLARRRADDSRRPFGPAFGGSTGDAAAPDSAVGERAGDAATIDFLLELGETLIAAGDAVRHVESTLRTVARGYGIAGLGVLVLPTALVLSLQRGETASAEVRTGGAAPLRLDQVDDVFRLVAELEAGALTVEEGHRELARIRAAPARWSVLVVLAGYTVSTVGLAMILRGGWLEVAVAAVLGLAVGGLRLLSNTLPPSYEPFWPLVAAALVSAAVFTAARVFDHLVVFPALIAPLISFIPGALLTIAVLELATGDSVAGTSRVAAGGMRLVLLALGIVAGAQLVGMPGGDIRAGSAGVAGTLAPWLGVAVFGIGMSWFNGARRESQPWILLVLYVAYAGQVVGGLFFGSSLSPFFGALAMTPVALLVSRQRHGPTPLVTFLPAFWLLVPGALGLEGVTRIIGEDGRGTGAIITAVTSMVAISLGILLGLAVSAADPSQPWSTTRRSS